MNKSGIFALLIGLLLVTTSAAAEPMIGSIDFALEIDTTETKNIVQEEVTTITGSEILIAPAIESSTASVATNITNNEYVETVEKTWLTNNLFGRKTRNSAGISWGGGADSGVIV